MELKLTGIALNRSKNHIGETTTDKGVQVGNFLLKKESFFVPLKSAHINPLQEVYFRGKCPL